MMKSTYGTGCFALLHTGADMAPSKNRLLTTIAYRLAAKRRMRSKARSSSPAPRSNGCVTVWASSNPPGKAARWPRTADPNQDVYLVPAFTGLGAPWWDADARGAIYGLTRNSGPAEISRAALESVAYQTNDLLTAMKKDWKGAGAKTVLRVDGGMVASRLDNAAACRHSRCAGGPPDRS